MGQAHFLLRIVNTEYKQKCTHSLPSNDSWKILLLKYVFVIGMICQVYFCVFNFSNAQTFMLRKYHYHRIV